MAVEKGEPWKAPGEPSIAREDALLHTTRREASRRASSEAGMADGFGGMSFLHVARDVGRAAGGGGGWGRLGFSASCAWACKWRGTWRVMSVH